MGYKDEYGNVFTIFLNGDGELVMRYGASVMCSQGQDGKRRAVKVGGRPPGDNRQTIIPLDREVGEADLTGEPFEDLSLLTARLNQRPSGTMFFDPFGSGHAAEAYVVFIAPEGFSVDDSNIVTRGVRQGGEVFLIRVRAGSTVTLRGPVCGEEAEFNLNFDPAKGQMITQEVL